MKSKWILVASILIGALILAMIAATAVFDPESSSPAAKTAGVFVRAALNGEDAAASPLLDADLQTWAGENCPDGRVSACVQSYIPPEWGALQGVVFRRAAPDAGAWNVEWIATYTADKGASGVCIYTRVEPDATAPDSWRVAGWAGFIHCGDPASRGMATNPDAPNRAP